MQYTGAFSFFLGTEKKLILRALVALHFRNVASKCIPIWDRFARILL